MLASGKNVVNTSFVPLLFPKAAGDGVYDQLQAACEEGGTSFFTSGIDPGFGNAGMHVHALALCKEVRTVRMMEIVNYDTWDNPFTMFEIMGFGKPDTVAVAAPAPGSTTLAWGPGARAGGRGHRPGARRHRGASRGAAADRDITIASGTVAKGTISGHALRDRRHGRRRGARSSSSTSPACATRTPRTGRRARATGSSSRASRT